MKLLLQSPLVSPAFWLRRLLALLLPAALVAGLLAQQEGNSNPCATYWAASVTAESEKQYDKAIEQISLYQKADGDKFLSMLRYGWLCYLKGDYDKAEAAYSNALKMERSSLNAALGLLDVAQAKQDLAKTVSAAEIVLRVSPFQYRALMVLGAAQYNQQDFRKSSVSYHKVLQMYPDDIDAASGAAWADLKLGLKREALANFKKILSVKPDYTYAQEGYDFLMGKKP